MNKNEFIRTREHPDGKCIADLQNEIVQHTPYTNVEVTEKWATIRSEGGVTIDSDKEVVHLEHDGDKSKAWNEKLAIYALLEARLRNQKRRSSSNSDSETNTEGEENIEVSFTNPTWVTQAIGLHDGEYTDRIQLTHLTDAMGGFPTQWEGYTLSNEHVYIRYRHGWLSISVYEDDFSGKELAFQKLIGGQYDGVMDTTELFDHFPWWITYPSPPLQDPDDMQLELRGL